MRHVILLVSVLLFLVACGEVQKEGLGERPFKEGYKGLVITTNKEITPETIYQKQSFGIGVNLENQGAYQLKNGIIKILGFDSYYFYLEESEHSIESREGNEFLEGKSQHRPEGEKTYHDFALRSKELSPGATFFNNPYFIQADFEYNVEFSQKVCMDTRDHDFYDAGCKIEPRILFNGQGSPLAITELRHTPGETTKFRLFVENKGNGKVKKINIVKSELTGKAINCKFKDNQDRTIEPKDKQEVVILCETEITNKRSYPAILFVELSFTYSQKERKTLRLEE